MILNPYIHTYYVNIRDGASILRERQPLASGDKNADEFVVHLQDCGKDVDLGNASVTGKVLRPDGQTVPLTGTIDKGAAHIVLDENCYAVPGEIRLTVTLSAGNVIQSVLIVMMDVQTCATNIVVDNGVVGSLTELLAEIANMRNATDAANDAAAAAGKYGDDIAVAVRVDDSDKDVVQETLKLTHKTETIETNIISNDGSVSSSSISGWIDLDVQEGDVISADTNYINLDGVEKVFLNKIVAVCAYRGDVIDPDAGKPAASTADDRVRRFTIPKGITRAIVTFYNVTMSAATGTAYQTVVTIERTTVKTNIVRYLRQPMFGEPMRWSGDLSVGDIARTGFENVNSNKLTTFSGHIGTMGTLRIGGYVSASNTIARPYIDITATHVNIYPRNGSSFDRSYEHGLTLSGDVQVMIEQGRQTHLASLIVQSGGNRWTMDSTTVRFGAAYEGLAVSAVAGIYTGCAFAVSIRDINRPVWVFGDSWVSYEYDSRWPYHAAELGLDKWLLSGYAGEKTADALTGLKALLAIKTPKMVVWMMGMNDVDTDDNTPNASWLACLEEVKTICENRDITLILYTVPTTSNTGENAVRNNNAKNAVIRASGYRYIDCVAAMGADESGNWFAGYPSSDGAHTTVAGAKALMARIYADVPEMAYWS